VKNPPPLLILASSSPYRAELLRRLGLGFSCLAPGVDESPLAQEAPQAQVERLSQLKASAVRASLSADPKAKSAVVIGSDQLCAHHGQALGKPLTPARAVAQLTQLAGHTVDFYTGWCVQTTEQQWHGVDHTQVTLRRLSAREIARYVELEQPLDCAGSFKAEGLGVCLFDAIHSQDPTALIGLPLIAVAAALRAAGLDPLA
jgi:septum formation protein